MKTWLTAVAICIKCILYPKSQVVITAMLKEQATEIFTKILGLMKDSTMLREEISDCSNKKESSRCLFWNGSTVYLATMSNASRHTRATDVIVDEFVQGDIDIINGVISAFLGDPRRPRYLTLQKYKGEEFDYLKEQGREIYMSSAWYKNHWGYQLFYDATIKMAKGNNTYFTCALPYQTAVKSGLRSKQLYLKEMSKVTMSQEKFDSEYSCKWMTESENGYYKFDILDNARKLRKAQYPSSLQTMLSNRDTRYRKKKKEDGVIYIVSADIAMMGGNKNDLSVYCVLKLIEKTNTTKKIVDGSEVTTVFKYYDRELVYMENHEGALAKDQACRLKELFTEFNASYLVVDAMGVGNTVIQLLADQTENTITGEEYPPMKSIRDDDYALMCQYNYAIECVVPVTASLQSNSKMHKELLGHLLQGRIKLLTNESNTKEFLYTVKGFDDEEIFNKDIKRDIMSPYKETDMLIEEMLALEKQPTEDPKTIKLKEPAGKRKDRYSSFLYANGFADELEKQMITTTTYDEDDCVIDVYYNDDLY